VSETWKRATIGPRDRVGFGENETLSTTSLSGNETLSTDLAVPGAGGGLVADVMTAVWADRREGAAVRVLGLHLEADRVANVGQGEGCRSCRWRR